MTSRRRWLLVALFLSVATTSLPSRMTATATPNNYSPYHYDQTTPLFTPDGRLLQVEYAAKAADDYASPVLLLPYNASLTVVLAWTPRQSLYERLVVQRDCIFLLSGLLPDSLALFQEVQSWQANQARQSGQSPSARACATQAAALCHASAMGGGLRPWGARLAVLSASPASTVWWSDPSGGVQSQSYAATTTTSCGGGGVRAPVVLTGPARVGHTLRAAWPADGEAREIDENVGTWLRSGLRACGQALAETDESSSSVTTDDDDPLSLLQRRYRLQVVFLSAKRGIYALPAADADRLLSLAMAPSSE
jgi:hypothetical protein